MESLFEKKAVSRQNNPQIHPVISPGSYKTFHPEANTPPQVKKQTTLTPYPTPTASYPPSSLLHPAPYPLLLPRLHPPAFLLPVLIIIPAQPGHPPTQDLLTAMVGIRVIAAQVAAEIGT